VRLEVSGIDHQLVGTATLCHQLGQDTIEHAQPAPADETVVDSLVRTIAGRSIAPRRPLRMTNRIPLSTRRSSTRGTPCDSGK
jgi:hypothetical protein